VHEFTNAGRRSGIYRFPEVAYVPLTYGRVRLDHGNKAVGSGKRDIGGILENPVPITHVLIAPALQPDQLYGLGGVLGPCLAGLVAGLVLFTLKLALQRAAAALGTLEPRPFSCVVM
jgi:hypothetical protein